MRQYKGDIMLLTAAAVGGTGFVFLKYLLEMGYSAFQIIMIRFLIATVLLCIVYCKQLKQITIQECINGAILGIFLFWGFVLLTIGLQYTTPSINAFLGSLSAIVVPFILWGIFHKKPNRNCFIAVALTMVGIVLLSDASGSYNGIGMILSFSASVAFAFQVSYIDKFLKQGDAVRLALIEHITVLVLSSLLVLRQIKKAAFPLFTPSAIKYFLLLGTFCTAIYFVLQSVGQKYTKPSSAAIILTTESVFGSIFAALLYGERLSFKEYVGCAMIFFAVIVAEKKQKTNGTEINS